MTDTTKQGEYRRLTPKEIGSMVAMFRKTMDWKQLTLALEAGVNERTVQRIECGEKVDDGTLRKIAKAFRVPEESFLELCYMPTGEELQARFEKTRKELMLIEAHSLSTIKDCDAILGGDGNIVDDSALPEEMADQIAALRDQFQDWGDIWSDLTNVEKLESCRSFFAEVQKIEEQGFKIRYAVYDTEDNFRISVLVFGASNDDSFANRTEFVVPRRFAKLAIQTLRG